MDKEIGTNDELFEVSSGAQVDRLIQGKRFKCNLWNLVQDNVQVPPQDKETYIHFQKSESSHYHVISQGQTLSVNPEITKAQGHGFDTASILVLSIMNPGDHVSHDPTGRPDDFIQTQQGRKQLLGSIIAGLNGNHLKSEDAEETFRQPIEILRSQVSSIRMRDFRSEKAPGQLILMLALMCKTSTPGDSKMTALEGLMSFTAEFLVLCCDSNLAKTWNKLEYFVETLLSRLISNNLFDFSKYPRKLLRQQVYVGAAADVQFDHSDKFKAWEMFSDLDRILMFKTRNMQECLNVLARLIEDTSPLKSVLNPGELLFVSNFSKTVRILTSWIDKLCTQYHTCTYPGSCGINTTFTDEEKVIAARAAVIIETSIMMCLSQFQVQIDLRNSVKMLFNPRYRDEIQIIYTEIYIVNVMGISFRLVVSVSNIQKLFSFISSDQFISCLEPEIAGSTLEEARGSESSAIKGFKTLFLRMGNPTELGLDCRFEHDQIILPDSGTRNFHKGTNNRSISRQFKKIAEFAKQCVTNLSVHLETEPSADYLTHTQPNKSKLIGFFIHAGFRSDPKYRSDSLEIQVNTAIGVDAVPLLRNFRDAADVGKEEYSIYSHTAASLWHMIDEIDSAIHQNDPKILDQLQASIDIFSSFPGFFNTTDLKDFKTPCRHVKRENQIRTIVSVRDIIVQAFSTSKVYTKDDLRTVLHTIQATANASAHVRPTSEVQHSDADMSMSDCDRPADDGFMNYEDTEDFSEKVYKNDWNLVDPDSSPSDSMHSKHHKRERIQQGPDYAKSPPKTKSPAKYRHGQTVRADMKSVAGSVCIGTQKASYSREEYVHICREQGLVRLFQVDTVSLEGEKMPLLSVAAVLPNPNPRDSLPLLVLISRISASNCLYISCTCKICEESRKRSETPTQLINFFNSRIMVTMIQNVDNCICTEVMKDVLLQCSSMLSDQSYTLHSGSSLLRLNTHYCIYYSDDQDYAKLFSSSSANAKSLGVSQISTSALHQNGKSIYYSVLSWQPGLHSFEHSFVRQGFVMKQVLREQCKDSNPEFIQLFCTRCEGFLIQNRQSCRHTKAVFRHLQGTEPDRSEDSETDEIVSHAKSVLQTKKLDASQNESVDPTLVEEIPDAEDSEEDLESDNFEESDGLEESDLESRHKQDHFDPEWADDQTGYRFRPTLSSTQLMELKFCHKYGQTAKTGSLLQKQAFYVKQEYLSEDKTVFDLCSRPEFQNTFLAPSSCVYCSTARGTSLGIKTPATVYWANNQIGRIPAESWLCGHCNKTTRFDGRDHGLWFHSSSLAVHQLHIFAQIKGFVHNINPKFSSFVMKQDELVLVAMCMAPVKFVSQKIWRHIFFSATSTFKDFRNPCFECLLDIMPPPDDLDPNTIKKWVNSAPAFSWDCPAIIQDGLADMLPRTVAPNTTGSITRTAEMEPVNQCTSSLDRCFCKTGGFLNGREKLEYKSALKATPTQREEATSLRRHMKAYGKWLCTSCDKGNQGTVPYDDMKGFRTCLEISWQSMQASQKKAGSHPVSCLLDVLQDQTFPSSWQISTKCRFVFQCGCLFVILGSKAGVTTFLKDWVVADILAFSRVFSQILAARSEVSVSTSQDENADQSMGLLLKELDSHHKRLLKALEPNRTSIPSDPVIFHLFSFTSVNSDCFADFQLVNKAVTDVLRHLACRVCEVFSKHKMMIDGCEDTNIFNPSTDVNFPAKIKPLRYNRANADEAAKIHDLALKELESQDSSKCAGYNPPLTGCALYFTKKADQVRKVKSFNEIKVDLDCTKQSYTRDALSCKHSNSDMIFLTLCLHHYECIGFSRVFQKEGRKDLHETQSAYKLCPAAVSVYDFNCG